MPMAERVQVDPSKVPDPAAHPSAPAEPQGSAAPPVEPTGGGNDAAAQALLHDRSLVLDADAQHDIAGGVVDPRLVTLLGKLTETHKLELSVIKTGHPQFTTGGSVSNHFTGRALDVARVDGQIVNSGSTAARELVSELADIQGPIKPTEIGSPFSISGPGFFTDADHQDHVHIGFDGPPPPDFKAQIAGPGEAPASPAAPAGVAAPTAVPGASA